MCGVGMCPPHEGGYSITKDGEREAESHIAPDGEWATEEPAVEPDMLDAGLDIGD